MVSPNPDNSGIGSIENKIFWRQYLSSTEDRDNLLDVFSGSSDDMLSSGELLVRSRYTITTKGQLSISLDEHVLMPLGDKLPEDPQELVMSMQRTVPFDFFDPDEATFSITYLDPELKIVRVAGKKFVGVVNLFIKK